MWGTVRLCGLSVHTLALHAVPVAGEFHVQAVRGPLHYAHYHGGLYHIPVPHDSEHRDDYRAHARDGASAPVPFVRRVVRPYLHGACGRNPLHAIPGLASVKKQAFWLIFRLKPFIGIGGRFHYGNYPSLYKLSFWYGVPGLRPGIGTAGPLAVFCLQGRTCPRGAGIFVPFARCHVEP